MVVVSSLYDFTGVFDHVLIAEKNKDLPHPVADHPDMNLFVCDNKAFVFKGSPFVKPLLEIGYDVIEINATPKPKYPDDVALNALATDSFFLCNEKTVADEIIKYINTTDRKIVSCNQGYCACSTLYIGNNSFITADQGIATTLKNAEQNVLLIQSGKISLPGYDYGFIGGAAGFVDEMLYFCGNIKAHPDYEIISNFLKENFVCFSCLPGKLTDVGGIKQIPDLSKKDELLYL